MAEEEKKDGDKAAKDAEGGADKKPSSPWPSAQKSVPPPAAKAEGKSAAPPGEGVDRAAWGRPLDRLDRAWTKLEARLCAGVLVLEFTTLVFWIAMKSMALSGRGGPGMIFRMLFTAAVLGAVTNAAFKRYPEAAKTAFVFRHDVAAAIMFFAGLFLGAKWGDAGSAYFANLLAWMQNSSILVFFGGVSEIAKRLTLWLALLGASLATAQGKHINVDVVMRFLTPKARVPVAVLGWLAAGVVSLTGAWGFFDSVAVEEFHAPTTIACGDGPSPAPGGAERQCPAPAMTKVDHVLADTGRNLFLAGRQLSLDLRTMPRVLGGTPYGKSMTPKEWNEWLRDGGWTPRFKAEDVKAFELPEDGSIEFRNPSVTAIPGGTEAIPKILVPLANMIFAFGLLAVALRFLLRSLLAISGWVKVDPNAAHGDEGLVEAHDHSPQAHAVEEAIKETVR
jgi:hypothetical protein